MKLTQEQVAQRLRDLGYDVTHSAIARWESGARAIPSSVFPLFAASLGIGPDAMFADVDQVDQGPGSEAGAV